MPALLLAALPSLARAQAPLPVPASTAPLSFSFTVEEYAELAVARSLKSRVRRDALGSGEAAWKASRRALVLPRLDLDGSAGESYADDDLTTAARTYSATSKLALTQPFLTGADLTLAAAWRHSETRTAAGTFSRARLEPQTSATLTQPLFLFVGNHRLRERRRAGLGWESARAADQGERLEIAGRARELYYSLVVSRESLSVERRKFESAKAIRDATASLARAGKLAPVELTRTELKLKRDARLVQKAESESRQALDALKDFAQLPAEAEVALESRLEYRPLPHTLERVLKEALRANPAVRSARTQAQLAEMSLAEAREGGRPRLALSGSYAYDHDLSAALAPRDPRSWSGLLTLQWPLFDATQTSLRTEQGRLGLDSALARLTETERQVEVAVRKAYEDLKRIEEQARDFGPQRVAARDSLKAVQLQYESGLSKLIDVFDAENELRELALESLAALRELHRARQELSRLVGSDLQGVSP